MNAVEKLNARLNKNLHMCIGLDPDIDKIPVYLKKYDDPIFEFNKQIIENTSDLAAAYKINLAFYERHGLAGWQSLQKTINYIPKEILVIGDAKRGDIGNTSKMYAEAIFNELKFDSVTLHPYMGIDSVKPFFEFKEKLNWILALTSNPGSADFEKLKINDGEYLFQKVIKKVHEWNVFNNCGIVFGATNPEELKENISRINKLPVLLPGVGAQGGDLKSILKIFLKNSHDKYIINSSRGIIFADNSEKFQEAARKSLVNYQSIIESEIKSKSL